MEKLIALLVTIILVNLSLIAQQSGKIIYKEVAQMNIQIDGIDPSILDKLPKSRSSMKTLIFDTNQSIFSETEGTEAQLDDYNENEEGQIKIMVANSSIKDILYKNNTARHYIHQKDFMGKAFLVNAKFPTLKWKITNEKIKYLGYICQKATLEEGDENIVAWFTSQIPNAVGPSQYQGLPGAILMLSINDGKLEYKATNVKLGELEKNTITIPDEGKKVSPEEYEIIKEKKKKELMQQYSGKNVQHIKIH